MFYRLHLMTNNLPPIQFARTMLDFSMPYLMGVVNVTPDSFSDGGQFLDPKKAIQHGFALAQAGAHLLDIGGESTRPGSESVDAKTECARVLPVIKGLHARDLPIVLSVDTTKAEVAEAALKCGAEIVNDVSSLSDADMASVVAKHQAGLVLMHMRGTPKNMQQGEIVYANLLEEIQQALLDARDRALSSGVDANRIFLDPGIGFGKTVDHNLSITKHLRAFCSLGHPVVYGPSRKSFLGAIIDKPPAQREFATAAVCAIAVMAGIHVLRVHDVSHMEDVVRVAHAVKDAVAVPDVT